MSNIVSIGTFSDYAAYKAYEYSSQSGIDFADATGNLYVGDGSKSASITNTSSNSKFFTTDEDVELVSVGSDITFKNDSGSVSVVAIGSGYNIDMENNDNPSQIFFTGSNSSIKTGGGCDYVIASGTGLDIKMNGGTLVSGKLDIEFNKGTFYIKRDDSIISQIVNKNIREAVSGSYNPIQTYNYSTTSLPDPKETYDTNGNLTGLTRYGYMEDGKLYKESYSLEYNSYNNLESQIYLLDYFADGIIDYKEYCSLQYDDKQNCVKETFLYDVGGDDTIDALDETDYVYDDDGALTECTYKYDEDNDGTWDYIASSYYRYNEEKGYYEETIEIDENGDGIVDEVRTSEC